jgi:lysophospholipase L1-like esterase
MRLRLGALAAVVAANGVTDPFTGPPLRLGPATLAMPGLVTNTYRTDVGAVRQLSGLKVFDPNAQTLAPRPGLVMARELQGELLVEGGPDECYWIAPEIHVPDDATVVFSERTKHLIVMTLRLVVGKNVVFQWNPANNTSFPLSPPPPKEPNNAVVSTGARGQPGDRGRNGERTARHGEDGPLFEMWALEIVGSPWLEFGGQDGQDGQDGGEGGRGGPGGAGQDAEFHMIGPVVNPIDNCKRLATSGGRGGRGGDGGTGGDGGNGGKGGRVEILTLPETIPDLISDLRVLLDPGNGGRKGRGGQPGDGGPGGPVGRSVHSTWKDVSCGTEPGAEAGDLGQKGDEGEDGEDGIAAKPSQGLSVTAISEEDFRNALLRPLIMRVSPSVVSPGSAISISGRNFTETDRVMLDLVELESEFRTSDRMVAFAPDPMPPTAALSVVQSDGTTTNPYPIFAQVHVTGVTQGENERIRPGSQVVVTGSGFSEDSEVLFNGAAATDTLYVSDTELRCTALRPFTSPELQGPEPQGEPVRVVVRSRLQGSDDIVSEPFRITLDTVRMLVLGDSVMWGQGLFEGEKAWARVRDELRERNGGIAIDVTVLAHSGAVIDANTPDEVVSSPSTPPGAFGGEVPKSRPSINEQLSSFLSGADVDDTVDFVLLDGGGNDITIPEALWPFGKDMKELADTHCHDDLRALLERVAETLPNASVVVTGYFPIVSPKTDVVMLGVFLAALGFTVGAAGTLVSPVPGWGAQPSALAALVLSTALFVAICDRQAQFVRFTDEAIARAVEDVIPLFEPNRAIRFVSPGFRDENAIFAPQSFVFGVTDGFDPVDPPEVASERAEVCETNEESLLQVIVCPYASMGHPNPAGAAAYADAITRALSEISDFIL